MEFLIIIFSAVTFVVTAAQASLWLSGVNMKIKRMNRLYKCRNKECRRFSRKYFVDLKRDYDPNYGLNRSNYTIEHFSSYGDSFCPHCQNGYTDDAESNEKWIKNHRDAPQLTLFKLPAFNRKKEQISLLMYEDSIGSVGKENAADTLFEDLLQEIRRSEKFVH